jgi:inhibitor of KinA sporulation pathway (predicted exonuclease)
VNNRHFLIVDLEATCERGEKLPHSEIIEIGAVLVDEKLNRVSEFQTFVKPELNPILSDFCKELTTITQCDVETAPSFEKAIYMMEDWMDSTQVKDYSFVSWGGYDSRQINRQAERVGLNQHITKDPLNLRVVFAKNQGLSKKNGWGMIRTAEMCGITLTGSLHRAIDDAYNIEKIMPYVLGYKKIPPTIVKSINDNKKITHHSNKNKVKNTTIIVKKKIRKIDLSNR